MDTSSEGQLLCQQEEVPEPKAESTPSEVPVLLAPRELADEALLPNMSLLSSSPIAAQTGAKSVDMHIHEMSVQTFSLPRVVACTTMTCREGGGGGRVWAGGGIPINRWAPQLTGPTFVTNHKSNHQGLYHTVLRFHPYCSAHVRNSAASAAVLDK